MAKAEAFITIQIKDPTGLGDVVVRWRAEAERLSRGSREQKARALLLRTCADEVAQCMLVSTPSEKGSPAGGGAVPAAPSPAAHDEEGRPCR